MATRKLGVSCCERTTWCRIMGLVQGRHRRVGVWHCRLKPLVIYFSYCFAVHSYLNCFSVDKKWTLLSNALSGLFCASLNFINPQQSLNPKYSFAPMGAYGTASQNRSLLRYSTLPREIVCTENLTPFKKLLPCDSKVNLNFIVLFTGLISQA